ATNTTTLTITVFGNNDAPVAVADTNWAQEDVSDASGNVLVTAAHNGAPDAELRGDVADTDVDVEALTVTNIADADEDLAVAASTTSADGTVVTGLYGTLTIGADGSYSYILNDAAIQGMDDGEEADDVFTYTVSDGTATNTTTLTITVFGNNDAPTIGIEGGIHTVYEAGLPEGSGVGPTTKEVTGTFTLADSDGLDDLDSVKVNTTTFTIAQLSAATVGSPLLVGDTTAGALYITDYNGTTGVVSYKYVLDTAITDVPLVEEQDVFSVSVSDDGTTFSSPALITVTIVDDVPVEITPDGLFLENKGVVGTSDQLISDLNFIAGADGVGSVKFNSADIDAGAAIVALVAGAGTSSVAATDANGNELLVGGQPLYLYLSADGTVLTASVGMTSGGTVGYTVTLDGAGGTYTFNPEAVISNGTEVTATNLSSVGGGNVVAKVLSNIGGTTEDVLLTTKVGDTVNTNANAIGIGTGQSLTVGDGIRFDFVNGEVTGNGGNAVYTPDTTHNLTNQFRQQVALTAGGSHADIKVQAILAEEIDDLNYYGDLSGETPIPITTVKVYSGTLAEVQAGTATEVLSGGVEGLVITDNGDGSFNIAGLQDGWTFEISTTAEFSAVQIDSLDTTDNYKLEVFSYGGDSAGEPIDLNYNIIGTDGDGDAVDGTVDVTLYPDAVADSGTSLPGTTGDDILLGTNGADTLNGAGGNDTLAGNAGDDTLNGDAGDDTLYGGSGNDTLNGGADVDILFGGSGDDDLTGGLGSDLLTGGLDADTFTWLSGDEAGAPTDTITDFNVGEGDVLDLSNLLIGETNTSASLDSYLDFNLVGGDTVITVDVDGAGGGTAGQTIVLEGVDLTSGGALTDVQIIDSLLASNSLDTDV
ncbi:MAG: type I secretion C-terminal target domain-containing protein, partial [Porticoccaceae bacterium]